jgi:hypothetical protein
VSHQSHIFIFTWRTPSCNAQQTQQHSPMVLGWRYKINSFDRIVLLTTNKFGRCSTRLCAILRLATISHDMYRNVVSNGHVAQFMRQSSCAKRA